MPIIPVVRQLFLSEHFVRYEDSKADLYGIFNRLTSNTGFPYQSAPICVFAQLTNGLGRMAFGIQVRRAESGELLFVSKPRSLVFGDRMSLELLVIVLEKFTFPAAEFTFSSCIVIINGSATRHSNWPRFVI
jgi:hypothetical protein